MYVDLNDQAWQMISASESMIYALTHAYLQDHFGIQPHLHLRYTIPIGRRC